MLIEAMYFLLVSFKELKKITFVTRTVKRQLMSRREEINDNTYKKGTVKCYTVPKNN